MESYTNSLPNQLKCDGNEFPVLLTKVTEARKLEKVTKEVTRRAGPSKKSKNV
jgi:hypothetical protein